LIIN